MTTISFLSRMLRPGSRDRLAKLDTLQSGALFRHVTPRGTVEIAHIRGIAADGFGIRHVSFNLSFRYHDKEVEAGERTLSAAGFLKRYDAFDDSAAAAPDRRSDGRTEPTLARPGTPEG